MMRRKLLAGCLTMMFLVFAAGTVNALSIDVDFYRISNNADENVENQFHLAVLDQVSAFDDYAIAINSDQVLFTFTNDVGIKSSISEIYIDDSNPSFTFDRLQNSLKGSTGFTSGAHPGNLPGGATLTPVFEANTVLSADAVGNPKEGVNHSDDILGIVYTVSPVSAILDGLQAAFENGDIRVGLHVRAIGVDGESDSFVSIPPSPVPEPATMLLFGVGLLGIAGIRRKKK